jgi:hypothetical protein
MTITTISSRELNDVSRAKKAAKNGPVFITDRGRPAYVLLSYEEYQRVIGKGRNIVDALSMRGLSSTQVRFPRSRELPRPADVD